MLFNPVSVISTTAMATAQELGDSVSWNFDFSKASSENSVSLRY